MTNTTTAAPAAAIDEMARRLVAQDVRYCVSALVAGMLKVAFEPGSLIDEDDALRLGNRAPDANDYRDAAHDPDIGIEKMPDGWRVITADEDVRDVLHPSKLEAWRAAFDHAGEDHPDGSEIFEHWLVTDDLARRLEAQGEAVAHDVQGLTIWGRATTGQAIYADAVFQRIARDILTA